MAVPLSQFGSSDARLYAAYLATHYGFGGEVLDGSRGSGDGVVGPVSGCDVDGLAVCDSFEYFVALLRRGQGGISTQGWGTAGGVSRCAAREYREFGRTVGDAVSECGSRAGEIEGDHGKCDTGFAVEDDGDRRCDGATDGDRVCGVSGGRGRHYLRNQRKKNNRRVAKGRRDLDVDWRQRTTSLVPSVHKGVFSECTSEVQRELRESRAKMLIEKNKAAASQAAADKVKVDAMVKARVYELDVEARRIKLDESRESYIKKKLSLLPAGYAETVASEGLESAVPTLSSGSVSPNSSISVDQVNRMEDTIKKLTERVAQLTAEAVETSVKTSVSIDALKNDLREAKGCGPLPSLSQRGGYVSEFSFVRR